MSIRTTSVAGSFYPDSCNEINRYINHFNTSLKQNGFDTSLQFDPKAIIVPHAGYIYSGFTANLAYNLLKKVNPKRFVVIGPSHRIPFEGASVSLQDNYETPCAYLEIDTTLAQEIEKKFDFTHYTPQIHQEHSTETQFPFIQHYFPHTKVIEIVYGKCDYQQIEQIIDQVLKLPDTVVVVSTDLSHFYNESTANQLDSLCLSAIENLDLEIWNKGCEACGQLGVKALISYAQKNSLKSKLLDYRTSAKVTHDKQSVVGYTSAVFG